MTTKNTRTSSGQRMHFGTFLDVDGYWLDTVHFPQSASAYPFNGPGCYHIVGKVAEEFDFIYVEVSQQHRLQTINKDDEIKVAEVR